jgi:hypothetical protein
MSDRQRSANVVWIKRRRSSPPSGSSALSAGPPQTAVALLCPPLLAGCTKPVAYYAAHANERQVRAQACLMRPDNNDQDCRNAQAEFDALGIKAVNGRAVPN